MFSTWGIILPNDSTDLRWEDNGGDVFALRNQQTIEYLLSAHRPHWQIAQETGLFRLLVPFHGPSSPYVMRMSCHKALPNPNYLP